MKRRTARRGTVVASVAVVGLTVGAGAFVADAAHPASTAPTGSAAAGSGEPIKLGVLAECEGEFGGFNEDVIAGVTLAMINQAGATSNSRTTATEGFSGASTLLYHRSSPSAIVRIDAAEGGPVARHDNLPLRPHHLRTGPLPAGTTELLGNDDDVTAVRTASFGI